MFCVRKSKTKNNDEKKNKKNKISSIIDIGSVNPILRENDKPIGTND